MDGNMRFNVLLWGWKTILLITLNKQSPFILNITYSIWEVDPLYHILNSRMRERQYKWKTPSKWRTLTHWDRGTYTCVGNLTLIGSDNGLSPVRRQAVIWSNAWILSIGSSGTNSSETLFEIHTFSFKKMYVNRSSAKWRPFWLGLTVLSNGLTQV